VTAFAKIAGSQTRRAVLRRSALLALAVGAGAGVPAAASAQAPDLPTGRLRVGMDLGNVAFASRDPATGELRGVTVDLGRALAARLGEPFEPVVYDNGAQLTAALRTGAFDVTHQALDSEPAAGLDFGPVIVEVDNTYLVRGDSPIRRAADADRPGVRITASRGGAPGLFLERNLKQATLVPADTGAAAFELLRAGQADAYAANRQILLAGARELPGSRVLDDRFLVVQRALGVPKGRPGLLAAVTAFSREALASGLVRDAIARSGAEGIQAAAAPAPTQLPRTGGAPIAVGLPAGLVLIALGLALRRARPAG
jgi:polar amino acid transport system substrate-binding protein